MTPGCQNEDILRQRVDTAGMFADNSKLPWNVYTSGLHPEPRKGGIRNPNEARTLESYWQPWVSQLHPDSRILPRDETSRSTVDNVAGFLRAVAQHSMSRQRVGVCVASSTSHLPRIAAILDEALSAPTAPKVAVRILVGSEVESLDGRPSDQSRRLKTLLVETYLSRLPEPSTKTVQEALSRNAIGRHVRRDPRTQPSDVVQPRLL